jgi:hypothetical protein
MSRKFLLKKSLYSFHLTGKKLVQVCGDVQEEAMKENDIGRKNIIFILYVWGEYIMKTVFIAIVFIVICTAIVLFSLTGLGN